MEAHLLLVSVRPIRVRVLLMIVHSSLLLLPLPAEPQAKRPKVDKLAALFVQYEQFRKAQSNEEDLKQKYDEAVAAKDAAELAFEAGLETFGTTRTFFMTLLASRAGSSSAPSTPASSAAATAIHSPSEPVPSGSKRDATSGKRILTWHNLHFKFFSSAPDVLTPEVKAKILEATQQALSGTHARFPGFMTPQGAFQSTPISESEQKEYIAHLTARMDTKIKKEKKK